MVAGMSRFVSITIADAPGAAARPGIEAMLEVLAREALADGWAGQRLLDAEWQDRPAFGAGPIAVITIAPADAGVVDVDQVRGRMADRRREQQALAAEGRLF